MTATTESVRRMTWAGPDAADPETLLNREWLVTNGLGGSASGTVAGVITRRHHGLLVAALPAPHGRTVMLSHLYERLRLPDGSLMAFGGDEREGDALEVPAMNHLVELRLEQGLPIWRYDVKGYVLEKRLLLPHLQNTVHVTYRLLSGPGPVRLELRPSVNFRPHEDPVDRPIDDAVRADRDRAPLRDRRPAGPAAAAPVHLRPGWRPDARRRRDARRSLPG